ncbi:MAG: GreA/GreB family elongation factor [Minisyncoccia bacterium]
MGKNEVIREILKEIRNQKSEIEAGLISTRQAAKEAPGAMESHSDTTKSQMHTLATNMEKILKEKELIEKFLENLMNAKPEENYSIKLGALTETEDQKHQKTFYLIVPEGGAGVIIQKENTKVVSISPETPLGSELINKKSGDTAILRNKNGEKIIKILNIF